MYNVSIVMEYQRTIFFVFNVVASSFPGLVYFCYAGLEPICKRFHPFSLLEVKGPPPTVERVDVMVRPAVQPTP
jgi:hypothetical protein